MCIAVQIRFANYNSPNKNKHVNEMERKKKNKEKHKNDTDIYLCKYFICGYVLWSSLPFHFGSIFIAAIFTWKIVGVTAADYDDGSLNVHKT